MKLYSMIKLFEIYVIYLLTFEAVLHSVTRVKHFFLKFLQ